MKNLKQEVGIAHCFREWMKSLKVEVGLPISMVSLLFLFGIAWTIALKASQATLHSPQSHMTSSFIILKNLTTNDQSRTTELYLGGTKAMECFRNHLTCFSESGKWVYDPTPRHLPWNYVGDSFASTCDARHQWSGPGHVFGDVADNISIKGDAMNWLVRENLKWVWQTNSSCPWQSINRDEFCKRIGSNGHLMVVGDSLNHEISWSLMNALIKNGSMYKNLSSNNRTIQGPYQMCDDIFGNGKGFKVSFVRNDRLSPVVKGTVDTWANFYEFPWLDLLGQYEIKTLLLNRGAHYEDDQIYTNALREAFTSVSLQYPHIRVIYRNTQPGHSNCMNFTQPLSRPQTDFPPDWHWGDFHRQNLLAKQIVEEFEFIYMDVYTMLSLRADGHISDRDCLHYCIPGPLDLVVEYLYNILLLA